jgi:hypothetical protein
MVDTFPVINQDQTSQQVKHLHERPLTASDVDRLTLECQMAYASEKAAKYQ